MTGAKIYVGNLPSDVKEREIEDIFSKYGKIRYCDIKGGRGPLYAFVEFDDERDAEDAVKGRDGYDFDGHRIRVEFCKGGARGGRDFGGRGGRDGGRDGGRGSDFRGTQYADRISGGHRRGGSRRTDFRVIVSGLPTSGSWQDLKDHMREAGDVCFTDVAKDGTGIVEYSRYDDMKYALKKLHDTKFRSHEGETSYITVRDDSGNSSGGGGNRRSRTRSRSRSPRRSRSRSARRDSPRRDSPRRDASASPKKSVSRSPSRSRSRSRSRS